MKIGELVKKTGVSRETIHYYIREGVLRKPRKTGKNVADYHEGYIEQIQLIKALRENYFLPIPVIKKLLRKMRKESLSEQHSFRFLSEYFRPLDHLLSGSLIGEAAFRKATGMSTKWLKIFEDWEIITFDRIGEQKSYSRENVIIGKLLVEMDQIGMGPRDGISPENLKHYTDLFRDMVKKNVNKFIPHWDAYMSKEELHEIGNKSAEVMSLFLYHFYRKVIKEEHKKYFEQVYAKNHLQDG
ncbi:MAG: MerR family transcriptional regulator [Desulfobacterales bacterium]